MASANLGDMRALGCTRIRWCQGGGEVPRGRSCTKQGLNVAMLLALVAKLSKSPYWYQESPVQDPGPPIVPRSI